MASSTPRVTEAVDFVGVARANAVQSESDSSSVVINHNREINLDLDLNLPPTASKRLTSTDDRNINFNCVTKNFLEKREKSVVSENGGDQCIVNRWM
ncbi:hypothetical protein ACH5RR_015146 [Cinchona calisaya]|uniref:Uncharacterized protein n=1 Tax=Cinchona calisaya TaxID=153742 RepID=A0ABD2ZSA5_9GENT